MGANMSKNEDRNRNMDATTDFPIELGGNWYKKVQAAIPDRVPFTEQSKVSLDDYHLVQQRYLNPSNEEPDGLLGSWKSLAAPGPPDVREMLKWYTRSSLYRFPKPKSIKLVGRGLTDIYFRVDFWPGHKTALPDVVTLRFLLPDCPRRKTDSEAAAMAWASAFSHLVPPVVVYDSSGQNPLQLEWIMTKHVEGFLLQDCLGGPCTCKTGLRGFRPDGAAGMPWVTEDKKTNIRKTIQNFFNLMEAASQFLNGPQPFGSLGFDWKKRGFRIDLMTTDYVYENRVDPNTFTNPHDYVDYFVGVMGEGAAPGQHSKLLGEVRTLLAIEEAKMLEEANMSRDEGTSSTTHSKDEEYRRHRPAQLCLSNLSAAGILVDEKGEVVALMAWENAVVMPKFWRGLVKRWHASILLNTANHPTLEELTRCLQPFLYIDPASRSDQGCGGQFHTGAGPQSAVHFKEKEQWP